MYIYNIFIVCVCPDTLADRTYVYQPNSLAGNKPVTIGHQYATIACLPEKDPYDPAWVGSIQLDGYILSFCTK